ncbi:MAG: hypothetical protein VX550_09040 [Bacteroidota bacterium]|nr:hypothetical protein [Bacteroidota bacterium]
MKKDIIIPVVKDVYVAIVKEWNDDFSSNDWNSYIINNTREPLETCMIMTRGKHKDGRKTSTMRHAFKVIKARSYEKIELMMEEVFPFENEFIVSYFKGDTLYDKTFIANPSSISESNFNDIPLMDQEGILLD